MSRHPINAFFRRGKPVPLTGNDFTARFDAAADAQDRAQAMSLLRESGFIREVDHQDFRIYEVTPAGVHYARAVLCIREARA